MYGNMPIHLLSGSTLLAAFYFASDPAVCPRSKRGKIYAGIFFGLVELGFRVGLRWSDALPVSILATQGMSFVIDQWLAPPTAQSASSVHIGISQSSLGRL
ncbi:MAG TPA: RnfABCDGE type electron transport complex subunit D, partial [Planctomycetota bacterium]|nr:RnfABCDGE type electron transport complex subunit D [Planctomycetota bacterium]